MFVVSVLSCQNKHLNRVLILSSGNKLWQLDEPKKNLHGSFTYYRFEENGKWVIYIKNREDKLHRNEIDDIVLMESWKLIGDSVINVGGYNYQLKKLNDTILNYCDPQGSYCVKLKFKGDKLPD